MVRNPLSVLFKVVLDLVVVGEDELPELDALGKTFAETEAEWVLAPPEEWTAKPGSGKAHQWNLAGITYTDVPRRQISISGAADAKAPAFAAKPLAA